MSRFNSQCRKGLLFIGVLLPNLAQAELTVIYDNGQTKPIAPFLEVFGTTKEKPQQSPIPSRPLLGAADPQAWLPIQSPDLTPGQVQSRNHNKPFTRPFFMIGSDNWSRQWLLTHRDRLKEIGAVGMLVQADTLDDLHAIAELADGLSILPASGADIAQALGISHYPVLISGQGIEQ
ncbi:MAG: integrating conjugative element protein [Candidatus Thiodiazotropha endolucinida]|nr:integrating conjugative element protein [Candidatus Thiodiazotropha endolucinida]